MYASKFQQNTTVLKVHTVQSRRGTHRVSPTWAACLLVPNSSMPTCRDGMCRGLRTCVMFLGSTSFNGDLSKWDASSVNDMDDMFFGAKTFKRKLCTAAWIHSKASKDGMFEGSSGSISSRVCSTTRRAFSSQSRGELKSAVSEYLESDGDDGQYGPIGEWDVSRVTRHRYDSYVCFCGVVWSRHF